VPVPALSRQPQVRAARIELREVTAPAKGRGGDAGTLDRRWRSSIAAPPERRARRQSVGQGGTQPGKRQLLSPYFTATVCRRTTRSWLFRSLAARSL